MKNLNLIFTIVIASSLLSSASVSYGATNPIPSPREQMDSGISPVNVICKPGLTLVVRSSSDSSVCVKKISSEKLLEMGWAIKVSSLLERNPQLSNIADVTTVKIVPVFVDKQRLDTNPNIVKSFNYIFEACAKSSFIRSPQVLVVSDSETKSVILSESMQPKSCQMSSTVIKANDMNSIKSSMIKKTDLSIIIGDLESKVATLKDTLAKEKKELASLAQQSPQPTDAAKKISEKTDKIISLRDELNSARADLQKNQYALIVGVKTPPKIEPPVDAEEETMMDPTEKNQPHVNTIKVVSQFSDAGRLKSDPLVSSFNFVFEACAGENKIIFPEILVRSDTEIKTIKMSEQLDALSCQTSSTVIKAADTKSITGTLVTTGDISITIKELEAKIDSLKENLAMDKKRLNDLTKQTPQPDDFREQITDVTEKIINQRNELNQAKQELVNLKYMIIE